ncbi:MAG: quinohemoprotein amine dehydrogenase subunit alpha [Rhodospirillales bacterium]|nr:quinohemoprotein amine dehydrogenase subunit alpha [Rhodospirillales bacterium]MDH3967458.1 quinohemoprotein amine dehydrogenase subunit alpha [Rhodospirillales bacterium]
MHRRNPSILPTLPVICVLLLGLLPAGPGAVQAQGADAASILNSRCAACHERTADGGLSRVEDMRKTPEGWDMAIVRMTIMHGVRIPAEERAVLVKHLADTQGLAPEETRDWRYILERRPNALDKAPDDDLATLCGRCHSFARVALQRRDAEEWRKLAHFHLGQFPTAEYQAMGRDRNWWEIVSTSVPDKLGKLYPLRTAAWTKWLDQDAADLSGRWRVAGRRPGKGAYHGIAAITASGEDRYRVALDLTYADGGTASGSGNAIVYTGYEWRARLNLDGESVLQVFTLSEDGRELSGRWFLEDLDSVGGNLRAVRMGPAATILAVEPAYLRGGTFGRIAIHGVGLDGEVDLGEGVEVTSTVSRSSETVVVEARATAGARPGARGVRVGGADAGGLFTVYSRIDSVRVEPDEAIARVGGAGGPLAAVPAQFEAVAYMNGSDGAAGTDDDQRIGVMPATWSVDDFNETAAAMKDSQYAGRIDMKGLFLPAAAGPNPERPFATNNAGDLAVKAVVNDAGRKIEGAGHLIVTVQRWNDPPIR